MVDQLILRARDQATLTGQIKERPHQLLLTGDQIYADDVALTMLATLQEVGGLLCGTSPEETFPRTKPSSGAVPMTSPDVRPGTARESFLRANSTLSSDAGMNHLMFLAEFCAMYVMCWSDELWPRDANGNLTLGTWNVEPQLAT